MNQVILIRCNVMLFTIKERVYISNQEKLVIIVQQEVDQLEVNNTSDVK